MSTCKFCYFGKKVLHYTNKYYCSKEIYEKQNKHNTSSFGCTRGVKSE